MVKVVVAEKPSVARDLAKVLGAKTRRDRWIERGDELRITWTFGHLAELKTPDEYDPALKRWRLDTLPFVPEKFELRPVGDKEARAQLEAVSQLCREADQLVCATDAGREGELIFRYVLDIAGCPERDFQRLWLSSMTDEAIKKAFGELRPRSDYENLHAAARCRSEADWIVGLNATRFHTVRWGAGRVLWSVGRVQTPVLALIAQRDDEIRTFDPSAFWELRTRYRGVLFKRSEGRFEEEAPAKAALEQVTGAEFRITSIGTRRETSPPPLLHDLTALQRQMNGQLGLSAARTLKIVQELYEKKLVTYPRTDSRHLPNDAVADVRRALDRLKPLWPKGAERVDPANLPITRRVFDDTKVTDHHAIIPTGNQPGGLDGESAKVYDAILRRLLQFFLPDRLRDVTSVEGEAAGVGFKARGVHTVDPGWAALEYAAAAKKKTPSKKGKGDDDGDEDQDLPEFQEGESGPHEPELHEGRTKPPRHWTESTILGAMETAGKFVDDDELREALKARGLGTPATRAAILETLLRRGYIERDKKQLKITDLGRYLVALIQDPLLKSAELTGDWEAKLRAIENGQLSAEAFMAEIVAWVRTLCGVGGDEQGGVLLAPEDGLGPCPRCGKKVIEGREGYGCSGWQDGCSFVLWKQWRGVTLRPMDARRLLSFRLLTEPVRIEGVGPRILCLTDQGFPIDLEVPSRERQEGRSAGGGGRSGGRAKTSKPASSARGSSSTRPAARKKSTSKPKDGSKPEGLPACPRCSAPLIEGARGYGCSAWKTGCRFVVWKEFQGKAITASNVRTLVEKGKTRAMAGFRGDGGAEFKARLVLGGDGEVALERAE